MQHRMRNSVWRVVKPPREKGGVPGVRMGRRVRVASGGMAIRTEKRLLPLVLVLELELVLTRESIGLGMGVGRTV